MKEKPSQSDRAEAIRVAYCLEENDVFESDKPCYMDGFFFDEDNADYVVFTEQEFESIKKIQVNDKIFFIFKY